MDGLERRIAEAGARAKAVREDEATQKVRQAEDWEKYVAHVNAAVGEWNGRIGLAVQAALDEANPHMTEADIGYQLAGRFLGKRVTVLRPGQGGSLFPPMLPGLFIEAQPAIGRPVRAGSVPTIQIGVTQRRTISVKADGFRMKVDTEVTLQGATAEWLGSVVAELVEALPLTH
jgi:hypothetical protein